MDNTVSANIVAQLLFLESDNPEKPISLYINSPGGSVTAGKSRFTIASCTGLIIYSRSCDLRHNVLHSLSDSYHLRRPSSKYGLTTSRWRYSWATVLPPKLDRNDPSTFRRLFRTGLRHRHPCYGDTEGAETTE